MAIISISGYIGSGKDLVTKIIQYLDYKENINPNIDDFVNIYENDNYFGEVVSTSFWENKKWADALKEVCSILTDIPRSDFEKPEVKNSVLGQEWDYYALKDDKVDFEETFTSYDEAKDYVKDMNCYFGHNLQIVCNKMTVRQLLQWTGTEAMRMGLHQNVWVNALMSKYKHIHNICYAGDGFNETNDYPNWVISDTRFYNELNAVKSRNGICIRVNRDDNQTQSKHPSERELDDAEFDYIIQNNTGEIEKLVYDVKEILIKEKLLSAS